MPAVFMSQSTVHFIGTKPEVAHHAAPLDGKVDYRITPAESILELAKPGDVAVFYSEHFDRFRDACIQLKQQNVATLYMLDGILEWRNAWEDAADGPACPFTMRPVLSHKVACIGASQKRILDSWGNEGKTEVTGVPRFDHLPRPPRTATINTDSGTFKILIATAKTPAFNEVQAERVERSLSDLKTFFESDSLPDGRPIQIVWRVSEALAEKLQVNNSLDDLTGAGLAAQLQDVDAVISTASTLMLEAMLFDRPLALLDYHNTPAYVKSAWRIGCREHIRPVVSELLRPADQKMLFQRTELNDAAYCQTDASARMAQLIQTMQELAMKQVAAKKPLSFAQNLLPLAEPASSSDVDFQHKNVFPNFNEFSIDDRPELQSQLGHSRREVEHLKHRLSIREEELAHAHQIFDKVNNHPIIGPVIKLGRWLQGNKEDKPKSDSR